MRTCRFGSVLATLCLVSVALAGCGDDSSNSNSDGPSATKDLAVLANYDMSMPGTDNCTAVLYCAYYCAGESSCISACVAKGSPAAMTKFTALTACSYSVCVDSDGGLSTDGGTLSCMSESDTSATCANCVSAAAQSTACAAQLGACLSL